MSGRTTVPVTSGAGFVGGHTCVELLDRDGGFHRDVRGRIAVPGIRTLAMW